MSLAILFHFLCAQHVSDINMGSDAVNAEWPLTDEHKENDSAVSSCRHNDVAWPNFINTPKLTLFVLTIKLQVKAKTLLSLRGLHKC